MWVLRASEVLDADKRLAVALVEMRKAAKAVTAEVVSGRQKAGLVDLEEIPRHIDAVASKSESLLQDGVTPLPEDVQLLVAGALDDVYLREAQARQSLDALLGADASLVEEALALLDTRRCNVLNAIDQRCVLRAEDAMVSARQRLQEARRLEASLERVGLQLTGVSLDCYSSVAVINFRTAGTRECSCKDVLEEIKSIQDEGFFQEEVAEKDVLQALSRVDKYLFPTEAASTSPVFANKADGCDITVGRAKPKIGVRYASLQLDAPPSTAGSPSSRTTPSAKRKSMFSAGLFGSKKQ